jgi:hypothetical protein
MAGALGVQLHDRLVSLAWLSATSSDDAAYDLGNYTLRTVNGPPLPFTFSDGATVTSDVLTIRDDGRFSDAVQFSGGTVQVCQKT